MVADQFHRSRTFICGDAAHLWVPMAGYGMNAGIADAMNLSWTLAAYLNGWASEKILEVYQIERQPITGQVSKFAMNHAIQLHKERLQVPHNIEDDSAEGEENRQQFGEKLYHLNVRQYCCSGLNFGYFYEHSPIIHYDDETAPSYDMNVFESSTVPGCRVPHFYLKDGSSLYDVLGTGYTLLSFDNSQCFNEIEQQAQQLGIPLKILQIKDSIPTDLGYKTSMVMVRPDQHVAWRGNTLPTDLAQFFGVLTARLAA